MPKRSSSRRPPPDVLSGRRALIAARFEEGAYGAVLEEVERLLQEAPRDVEALHYRAAALAGLGRREAAARAYREATAAAPDDLDLLWSAADFFLCEGEDDRERVEEALALCARGRKAAQRAGEEEALVELLLLEGTALNQLGECTQALARLEAALELSPKDPEAGLERAVALFELCRMDEARAALSGLLEQAPDEPWAHHYLGLIAERRGDAREARARFERAQALAPELFPPPIRLTDDEFDAALEASVARLPAHVKGYLENATIAVEELPSDEDLLGENPPLSPSILGVFRGVPVGERSVTSASDHFPAAIVLYQRNLERFARSREELIEQIGITLMHEVGHLVGLDEEDLWERGLD